MLHFSLVERIEDLKELINSEIYDTRQWADAKFASLELYNTIVDELCALQTIVVSNYEELEDYVASCCYYQALFAPRFGTSIIGNSFREVNLDENIAGVKNINDLNAHTAQKAAMLADYNMWSIMNPDDYTIYKH